MNSLSKFNSEPFIDALKLFFSELNVPINYFNNHRPVLPSTIFSDFYNTKNESHQLMDEVYILGMVDDKAFSEPSTITENEIKKADYDFLLIIGITLKIKEEKLPTRSQLVELTRLANKAFNTSKKGNPVTVIFKYNNYISFANAPRTLRKEKDKREGEILGKVSLLKDISTQNLHAGHERILLKLQIDKDKTNSFKALNEQWLEVFNLKTLNNEFYKEIANWYFWAMDNIDFPEDKEKKKEIQNANNLIRLITRVIFIWFIKEKKLVPENLFNVDDLEKLIKDFQKDKKACNYYKAILQNLFFGTLNQRMGERKFAKDADFKTNKDEYTVKSLYRYANLFKISENDVIAMFEGVPFLNGGLFDCLDNPEGKNIYVDGFSRNVKNQATVPDYLFFGKAEDVDLTKYYDPDAKKPIVKKVRGLINILHQFKFTVTENTPIEEEIALDPELLGKVFENLLASYNPETQTTARKQTGSFYTPREIVNYMVDESLIEYFKQNTVNKTDDFESQLRKLFSYSDETNPFTGKDKETNDLIEALNNAKILDPACGSGAFPMGVLHKMVHILKKIDVGNVKWKAQQKEKAIGNQIKELEKDKKAIAGLSDKAVREKAIQAVEERLKEIEEIFESENNLDDYARKLFLIENCIYGVDIQPIAVQISKLRFFISLIIDQDKDSEKENLGLRALPNLETKFVAANTLIGLDKSISHKKGSVNTGFFVNDEIEEKKNQLKELRHKYFTANNRNEKTQFQKLDKKLRQDITKLLENDGWQTKVAEQISSFDPYNQNHFANWFEPEWMFGNEVKDGFDIVIGNPPYGVKFTELEKVLMKELFPESQFKIDSYSLFVLKSISLLTENGYCSYIITNTLLDNYFEEKVREKILKQTSVKEINDLDDKVFETAAVHTMIFSFKKGKANNNNIRCNHSNNLYEGFKFIPQEYFLSQDKFTFSIRHYAFQSLIDKLNSHSICLEKIVNIKDGIDTGDNKKYIKEERQNKNWKSLIGGKDIDRYIINSHRYVLHGDHLANPRNPEIFEQEKIVVRETGDRIIATYDDNNHYALSTLYTMNLIDKRFSLKYLLGLLNSAVFHFMMKLIAFEKTKGTFTKTRIFHYYKLPIRDVMEAKQKPLIILVDKILAAKKANPKADTSALEKQIDEMVYKLYELTVEEISIVENSSDKTNNKNG